jgi:hypothetical protein
LHSLRCANMQTSLLQLAAGLTALTMLISQDAIFSDTHVTIMRSLSALSRLYALHLQLPPDSMASAGADMCSELPTSLSWLALDNGWLVGDDAVLSLTRLSALRVLSLPSAFVQGENAPPPMSLQSNLLRPLSRTPDLSLRAMATLTQLTRLRLSSVDAMTLTRMLSLPLHGCYVECTDTRNG